METTIQINNRLIGPGHPAYIIAELSANHNQDFDNAVKCLLAAKEAGADAVKLQTYTPDSLTINCDNKYFQIQGTLWAGQALYDLYNSAFMPWEWQPKLKEIADEEGIHLFSTPFDASAVDFLEAMDVPAHKIASFEIIDIELLRKVAQTGKPIILSTGMATLAEIDEAVSTIRAIRETELALLKCTSAYPAPPESINLRSVAHLARAFNVVAGLSDHTLGIAVPVAAVVAGASIIEKHFTLSRSIPTADSKFSLEPHEFRSMVDSVRTAEKALGSVCYGASEWEAKSLVFRRSLFVVRNIKAEEEFTSENVRSIRPGFGLHPRHLAEVLGRRATQSVERGTPLTWDLVGSK